MTHTIATEPSRQQAVDAVRSLKKPKEMSRTQWRSVKRVLLVIAKHYPKAIPSVATIAKESGLCTAQARRVIRIAEREGMLVTIHDGGENWQKKTGTTGTRRNAVTINKTSRYHIAPLYDPPNISGDEMSDRSTPSEYPLPSVVGPLSGSPRYARPQSAAVAHEDAGEIIREREAKVLAERGRLRTERPVFQTKPRKNDAVVLVEYFLIEWENLLARKPLLASNNAIDRKGESQGYLWNQLLRPEYGVSYTAEQVMEMIDAFFLDLASGRIGLKQRQSAWKAFTVHKQPPKPKTTRVKGSLSARNK